MSTSHLLVTVESSGGAASIELPVDVDVADLLPGIAQAAGHNPAVEGWSLRLREGRLLRPDRNLHQSGLLRGSVLQLIDPLDWPGQIPTPEAPSARGLVPRISRWQRARTALSVAYSRRHGHDPSPPGSPPSPGVVDPRGLSAELGPGPLGRIARVWRQTDYMWRLKQATAAPRSMSGMLIAVAALEAGSGTTTVTALLAAALSALRRERTAIVDAALSPSGLTAKLTAARTSDDGFAQLGSHPLSFAEFEAVLVRGPESAAVLPAPVSGVGDRPSDQEIWAGLLRQVLRWMTTVIVDCGAGLRGSAATAALAAADLVILVASRERPALDYLARAVPALQRPDRGVFMVANHLRPGLVLWPSALSPAVCPLVSLPFSRQTARLVQSAGSMWPEFPRSWQIASSELAALVMAHHG
jgi:Mrp family chromosome partitioning ATPase